MYAGITDIVDIPAKTESGYAAILKTGYVYWVTDSKWDKARKKTTDKRVPIGKIAPEPGKMYPNNRYAEIFGAKEAKEPKDTKEREQGSFSRKLSKTLSTELSRELSQDLSNESFNESSKTLPDELSEAGDFDNSMSYGPYAAMLAAFSKIGALDALVHAFPTMWRTIFAAALHAVLAETSSARDFSHWAFDNYAGMPKSMTDSDMEALFSETGYRKDAVSTFFDRFHKNFHASSRLAKCLIAFDNGTHAIRDFYWLKGRTDDNEKSEQDSPMPGIHTALYVDQATGMPIWYEHFDGSIFEKAETPYTAKKAASLGYQKLLLRTGCQSFSCTAVRDSRCYSSFQCPAISKFKEQNLSFCLLPPESSRITENTVSECRDTLRYNPEYLIPEQNIFGCAREVSTAWNKMYASVFYDDHAAVEERDKANSALAYFLEELRTKSRYTDEMARYFEKRAIIVRRKEAGAGSKADGPNFTYEIDSERLKKIYDDAGFFMIVSNRDLLPVAVIGIERLCRKTERTFQKLRKHFGIGPVYMHNNDSYDGKMFVAFVSMIMSGAFEWYCSGLDQLGKETSPASLLSDLHSYKMTRQPDGTWMPAYKLSRWQKRIFSCLGITEDMLHAEIRKLHI